MGTHCTIAIRLKDTDINGYKQCNIDKMQLPDNKFDELDLSNIEFPLIRLSKRYLCVYSHYDGYPSSTGEVLLSTFNTYAAALNLISGGDMVSVNHCDEGVAPKYYNLRRDKNYISSITPREVDYIEDIPFESYTYLFRDDKWYVSYGNNGKFKPLDIVLENPNCDDMKW